MVRGRRLVPGLSPGDRDLLTLWVIIQSDQNGVLLYAYRCP